MNNPKLNETFKILGRQTKNGKTTYVRPHDRQMKNIIFVLCLVEDNITYREISEVLGYDYKRVRHLMAKLMKSDVDQLITKVRIKNKVFCNPISNDLDLNFIHNLFKTTFDKTKLLVEKTSWGEGLPYGQNMFRNLIHFTRESVTASVFNTATWLANGLPTKKQISSVRGEFWRTFKKTDLKDYVQLSNFSEKGSIIRDTHVTWIKGFDLTDENIFNICKHSFTASGDDKILTNKDEVVIPSEEAKRVGKALIENRLRYE